MIIVPSNVTSAPAVSAGSTVFDGSGDYITITDNAAMELGSSDYTIEMWLKTTTSSLSTTFFSRNFNNFVSSGQMVLILNNSSADGSILLYVNYVGSNYAVSTSGVSVRDGSWHHIAVVRNGTNHTIYIDGTSRGTATISGSFGDLSRNWEIGRDGYFSGQRDFTGSISNLRVTKSAVYTSNFTPSTTPLTAIANTSLLTCQSSSTTTVDNSGNGLTLTAYGNTTAASDSPFS